MAEYLLTNRSPDAGQRFESLAALFNPVTFRHLEAVGIGTGWRCWEVGAGGPSVPAWMAARTGPRGYVLATDIDVSWMPGPGAGMDVRRHDVVHDDPPDDRFDLVHVRLVLSHLPERDAVLRRLAGVLRPDGWLLVEDFDGGLQPRSCLEDGEPEQQLANRVRAAFHHLLTERGADLRYARTLPRRLRACGLVDVAADAYFPVAMPAAVALEAANIHQVRDQLVRSGQVSGQEIDEHLAALRGGRLDIATPALVSVRGRAPHPLAD